ncbi:MAG: hypothetical protein LBE95_03650 [Holosporaceae bacterium]|jgi:hypothetical protein|nr:hypothetical protein [Holosporaceae bacterium]
MKIETVYNIPQEIENRIRKDWEKYDTAHGIDLNYKRFLRSYLGWVNALAFRR